MSTEGGPCLNTDREIWRETPGDYYSPSILVTTNPFGVQGIGINIGGHVIVMSARRWHELGVKACGTVARLTP